MVIKILISGLWFWDKPITIEEKYFTGASALLETGRFKSRMEKLQKILDECLNGNLVYIVLSGARKKEGIRKIKIRPIAQKGELLFQASEQLGKQ